MDCMEYMAGFQDGYFDLAVVDPPYGIGASEGYGRSLRKNKRITEKNWDDSRPDALYFKELFRVSKNQIIWGGNYFGLPATRCYIVWDKQNAGRNFADCEMAWTSFDQVARIFVYRVANDFRERFHPTQKPIALYRWIFQNYAKPGDRILDTHLGSGSSRIAAYDMGLDFYSCELDPDYFAAQEKRFSDHISKPQLFAPEQQYNFKQAEIFTPETLEK